MPIISVFWRLFLSVVLSGILGLEREKKGSPAGLRTHVLVSLGSTLYVLASLHLYEMLDGGSMADPSRIASNIVTGIGFLGAGTIIRNPENVKGLTTAASIWVAAAIGMSIGFGFWSGAVLTAFFGLFTLRLLRTFEVRVIGDDHHDVHS
jgi:putative Mg2+ transporter-C (MgtC) family protein